MKLKLLSIAFTLCLALPSFAADDTTLSAAQSMGASFNSKMYPVRGAVALNIQAIVSAGSSPVGTFKLQLSNKENPAADTDWVDMDGSSQAVSADGGFMWNLTNQAAKFIRLVYTRTSGSATVNAYVNAVSR